jgi:signal peptidase
MNGVDAPLARRHWRASLAGAAVALALLVVAVGPLRPTTLGGPAGYIIVVGGSMEPALRTGDLVITQRHPSYADGDVVAFSTHGGLIIHRIIGGDAATGYQMKGDNGESPDPWCPKPEDIVGAWWIRIPAAGRLLAIVPALLIGGMAALAVALAFTRRPVRLPGSRSAH